MKQNRMQESPPTTRSLPGNWTELKIGCGLEKGASSEGKRWVVGWRGKEGMLVIELDNSWRDAGTAESESK